MEDIPGSGTAKHPIENKPWDMILDFLLPAEPGCEVQAAERICKTLGDALIRPDRLIKLNNALEGAVKKSLDYTSESRDSCSIHFRVLVSGIVQASHFPNAEENAPAAPPRLWFFPGANDGRYRLGDANYALDGRGRS